MNCQQFLQPIIGLSLVLGFLMGCGSTEPPPLAEIPTPTSVPEQVSATPIPEPLTMTPEPPMTTPILPIKILFVGDSFSSSLTFHMEKLAGSTNSSLVIKADGATLMGEPLAGLWESSFVHKKIGGCKCSVVVLQENLPETDVDTFHKYARKFVTEVEKAGARPVLFMAWTYEEPGAKPFTIEQIAQAHRDIAAELGVEVAPVGWAWQQAMKERPDLDLYGNDRVHASAYGDYLTVNVLYATISGKSPVGLDYVGTGMTEEEAAFLQGAAWDTVQKYQSQR